MQKIMKTKLFKTLILLFAVSQLNAQNNAPQAATAGTLTVSFTTSASSAPKYGGKNIDACWVVNGDVASTTTGTWVKTLLGSTSGETDDLTYWTTATATTYNTTDAVTSATRSTYGTRTCTWNGTNSANPRVQQNDGTYTVKIEMTDKNGTGNIVGYKFTKGPANSTGTLSTGSVDATTISNVSVQWVSVATAIQDVELQKAYSVYPNPAVSSIYVSGLDITGIDICSLSGKILLMSDIQNVNISRLPKGAYLVVIYTKTDTVVKKIQKM